MADKFTETSSQSWGSRIMGSLAGIVIGLILVPLAVILLWWNEGHAVQTAKALKEGAATVVSVQADKLDSANNKKLIHVTGKAVTEDVVRDPIFRISAPALRLNRVMQMYQWTEEKESKTTDKLGGGQETTATYTYAKKWSDSVIDSSKFKHPGDHENPEQMLATATTIDADDVTLGAFTLSEQILSQMTGDEPLEVTEADLKKLPGKLKSTAHLDTAGFYFGKDPDAPAIGDQKVSFKVLKPGVFSIIGAQTDSGIEPYLAKSGAEILLVETDAVSPEMMFRHAESANTVLTWILRIVGFFVMFFGFALILNLFSTLASVIPFLGDILGAGIAVASFLMAFALSLLVIALAWLAYRPLFGGILILIAIGGFLLAKRIGSRKIAATTK
ncbi:MAG: TMEM43 family protein [Chthoniobacterales bacterium]